MTLRPRPTDTPRTPEQGQRPLTPEDGRRIRTPEGPRPARRPEPGSEPLTSDDRYQLVIGVVGALMLVGAYALVGIGQW